MSGFFSGSFDPFWPHAILLTSAIVASFAVAIGIVLENPKWSLANALVVGGVAIEAVCTLLLFGFDEGISTAQTDKIASLTQQLAPRTLTAEQASRITAAIAPYPKTPYDLAVDPSAEANFMFAIIGAFANADWNRVPYPGSNTAFPLGLGIIITHPGLQIRIDGSRQERFLAVAIALSNGFAAAGYSAPLIMEYPGSETAPDAIHVEIGRKP